MIKRRVKMKERNSLKRERVKLVGTVLMLVGFVFVLSLAFPPASSAARFPSKPVTLIVPYSPGGTTDTMARIMVPYVKKHLGQPVVIENNPGSGGVAGSMNVGKAKPDGYTMGQFGPGFLTAKYMLPVGPAMGDFIPVAQFRSAYRMLLISGKRGINSLKELVDFGKKNPGKLNAGYNPGSGSYLNTYTMLSGLNIEVNWVPYRGGGERRVALAGGHIDLAADLFNAVKSFADAKKIILLGVGSPDRQKLFPEVLTFKEQGYDVETGPVFEGFFVPKGTPANVVKVLETATAKAVKEPGLIEKFRRLNEVPVFLSGKDFGEKLVEEDASYKKLIQDLGLMYKKK
jgi:tripartite-type tricarboxylate transporter receptor subunit TctC